MTSNVGAGVFRPVRLPAVNVAVVRQVLVDVEGRHATLTGARITLSGLVLAMVTAAVDDPEGWIGDARDDRRSRDRWQPRAALAVVWPQDLLCQVRVLAAAYDVPVSGVLGAAVKSESAALVRLLEQSDEGDAGADIALSFWLASVPGDRRRASRST